MEDTYSNMAIILMGKRLLMTECIRNDFNVLIVVFLLSHAGIETQPESSDHWSASNFKTFKLN